MTRWTVLVTAPRACEAIDRYRRELGGIGCTLVVRPPVERHEEAAMLALVPGMDALVCGDDRITARVIDAAPGLKVIAKWGTGIDAIDLDHAAVRGVPVRNTPDAFSEPVADTVLGYILLAARGLDRMTADVRAGKWERVPLVALGECTLGIVGFGHIGQAVARRAAAFGLRVLACDDGPVQAAADRLGVRLVPMEAVLADSDFVTLHADLRPANRHLMGAEQLARMRRSAVLINTARGALIDEPALAEALGAGVIAGAALDVFEDEPLPGTSPLRDLPNVHLAPHNANSSPLAAERVHANTIRNVIEFLGPVTS